MNEKKRLYAAISRSMLSRYLVYAANVISMMILARLYSPEIFGIVASVMVFFVFFQLLAEAGLGPAIINIEVLSGEDRNGIFSLTLIVGMVLAGIFQLLAPVILAFYGLPRVDEIVPYIAASIFFFSATVVPNAFLLREQRFYDIAKSGLLAEVLSTTLSVFLLFWITPLHALAAKTTTSAAVGFFVLHNYSRKTAFGRPKLGKKLSAISPLLSFSTYQFGFNFINYFSRNLDKILVGRYLGASSLGAYDRAYQLMRYPLMLLTFAMTPAIQPVIRKYAGDKQKVEDIHRDFVYKLSLIGIAAGMLIFFLSDFIVLLVLGVQWDQVSPIIKILSVSIPVQVILSTSGSFYQAMGRADILFLTGVLSAIITVSAIAFGIYQRDLIVLSWSLVVAFHLNFLQTYIIMYAVIFKRNTLNFFGRMIPMLVSVATMLFFYKIK